jgi:hypothetical protein
MSCNSVVLPVAAWHQRATSSDCGASQRWFVLLTFPPQDAALLMHAGIASIPALASCTPERLVRQTGRLERSLGTRRQAVVDLTVARDWINRAKQLRN